MITKKNLLTALLFLFVSCPMWSQILKSSGIIVKAGKGEIAYNTPTNIDNMDTDIKNSYIKGKAALSGCFMRGIVVILEDYNERICSKIFFGIIKQRLHHPSI